MSGDSFPAWLDIVDWSLVGGNPTGSCDATGAGLSALTSAIYNCQLHQDDVLQIKFVKHITNDAPQGDTGDDAWTFVHTITGGQWNEYP